MSKHGERPFLSFFINFQDFLLSEDKFCTKYWPPPPGFFLLGSCMTANQNCTWQYSNGLDIFLNKKVWFLYNKSFRISLFEKVLQNKFAWLLIQLVLLQIRTNYFQKTHLNKLFQTKIFEQNFLNKLFWTKFLEQKISNKIYRTN